MTTINDIAKMAGVSRSTVSRFLNKNGYVSEEAAKRIQDVIHDTGYMPSQSAQSLRTKKSGVIGVILPKISTETASRVVSGINQFLQKNHYQVLLADTSLNHEKEIEFIRLLQSRNVDGIILLGTHISTELMRAIQESRVPIVVIGQDMPETTSVIYPDYLATVEMIEYMLERKYRQIAYIGVGEEDPAIGIERKRAYVDTLKKYHLTVREQWIQLGDFSIESGYQAMRRLMETSSSRPDAVFVVTDRMAIGAIQYLKDHQYRIPENVAIGATGASTLSKYLEPSLTTIDFQNEEAGTLAAQLMVKALEGEDEVEKKVIHSYRLLKRDSV
ncbi:LacI family DNA-binding transcriptional regulator [Gracilibacillus dipsosauri]|uniref:LacI family transcriptional regulator n=1 Tax=Gracilibacillus dipsosauri TaxID=178340 RepID=A0A317L6X5_9BACI|nr:LacI family DNA-binding transcriptional regulator [Gracilibacillus dipsosauri]PWU69509.1 LacI family transcriptional regulator [Gracilibacillus dipsosauri]